MLEYHLDDTQNVADISNFFAVSTETNGITTGRLYLIRSMENYPNNANEFSVQVSRV